MAAINKIPGGISKNLNLNITSPSRLDEGIGLTLFVAALIILLCLFSFDPNDNSWSVSGAEGKIHNWIGPFGAIVSDLFFQPCGLVAYLIPIVIGNISWKIFRGNSLRIKPIIIFGCSLLVGALSGLLSLFPELPFYRDRIRLGGALGLLVEHWLENLFSRVGTSLVLLLIAAIALMLITSFSPYRVFMKYLHLEILSRIFLSLQTKIMTWISGESEPIDVDVDINQIEPISNIADLNLQKTITLSTKQENGKSNRRMKEDSAIVYIDKEEKMRSEQYVAESLYSNTKTGSSQTKVLEAAKDNSIPHLNVTDIPKTRTSTLIKPVEDLNHKIVPATPILDAKVLDAPALPELQINNTRQVAREAIARVQQKAQQSLNQKLREEDPAFLPEPNIPLGTLNDPIVEKMVESASIVRLQEPPIVDTEIKHKTISEVDFEQEAQRISKPDGIYLLPPVEMLQLAPKRHEQADDELWDRARLLAEKCKEFNVTGQIQQINPGPVVTTFEFKPDPGVKYSRVANLVDDLCLALKAESIRIDRLSGKSTVGIEVPNITREIIYLREIAESEKYQEDISPLTIALGKTIEGNTYVSDLMKMPHLLIAGSTGSGKSVMVNTLICSILLKATPNDVKMILVDPKRLELGLYEGIPHLLTPIVTDPKRASNALRWAVTEMENRYKQLAGFGVRNIGQYNKETCNGTNLSRFGLEESPAKLPYIVIVIDELADLMMVASSDVETSITRLAQMARAVGIHLVVATQRPSVDVITGLIKANFPARISFRVASKVDSRTILDTNGAEGLLGQGDMLFLPPGTSRLIRIHGSYVGETEINKIVTHIKVQGEPQYNESIQLSESEVEATEGSGGERDELYDEAIRIIVQMGRGSTSVLQRRLRIGYGRAAAILDMMEREGYVGPSEGSKPRIVKQGAYDYIEMLDGHALNSEE